MKLIIQPDDGLIPLLHGVRKAKRQIDIIIFRFDRTDLEKALAAAVARKVVVRALIAHTNRGGEKLLRKLETRDRIVMTHATSAKPEVMEDGLGALDHLEFFRRHRAVIRNARRQTRRSRFVPHGEPCTTAQLPNL